LVTIQYIDTGDKQLYKDSSCI